MKKMYYCCVQCHTIFGCFHFTDKKEIRCSFCLTPCHYDGTHKNNMPKVILSHGLCKPCYYIVKDSLRKEKEAQNEKKL